MTNANSNPTTSLQYWAYLLDKLQDYRDTLATMLPLLLKLIDRIQEQADNENLQNITIKEAQQHEYAIRQTYNLILVQLHTFHSQLDKLASLTTTDAELITIKKDQQ